MKKVLSLICALFLTVAFAGVTLAAEKAKEMKPTSTDNTMKAPASTDNTMKAPEKKMEQKPAEKK